MPAPSPLDDPATAAHAWARYRRLMRWMVVLTLSTVVVTMAALYAQEGLVSIHFYIAMALGVGMAMMLTSALMGLVFLSAATGHDAALDDSRRATPRDLSKLFNPAATTPPEPWPRDRGGGTLPPGSRRSDVPE